MNIEVTYANGSVISYDENHRVLGFFGGDLGWRKPKNLCIGNYIVKQEPIVVTSGSFPEVPTFTEVTLVLVTGVRVVVVTPQA